MKNWKTTLLGVLAGISAMASVVAANPLPFGSWTLQAKASALVMALAIFGIGGAAKDATSHSTESEVEDSTKKDAEAKAPK